MAPMRRNEVLAARIANGREIRFRSEVSIAPGKEDAAWSQARRNGSDDVMFKVGDVTHIASGRGLELGGLKPGDKLTLNGKEGEVIKVDDQVNTAKEGLRLATGGGLVGGIGFAGVSWLMIGANIDVFTSLLSKLRMTGIMAAIGILSGVVLGGLGGAFYGVARREDLYRLVPFMKG